MEEKTLEEMLQEETPVTEEASGEMDAGQAPDPETAEETDAEAGQPEADQNNTDDTQDQPDDESDEEETEDGTGDEGSGEKKGFFGRRKKGDKEKAALQEKIAGLEDRVKRQMAEFDNFERGLAAIPAEEKEGPVASGMEMVYRQLLKQLEDLGVTPIEAVGKEFDPAFHNAVMQVESDEYESGTVAQEFQKGYKYHDTVIRYSMVGVVQ